MNVELKQAVAKARAAAIEVLLYNARHGRGLLPRTAAWGYPEPYTRDLLISALGILVSDNRELIESLRGVLRCLAKNQSILGHMPSLVDAPFDRGASDTTPLFLVALACYRKGSGRQKYLDLAASKALTWMTYQSPDDLVMVAQQPTSDWRDEQWVEGYGLYVNALVYAHLRLHGLHARAEQLKGMMNRFDVRGHNHGSLVHEGFVVTQKPYLALCSYKNHVSERFDLLGNSLAILTGICSRSRSRSILAWVETECNSLRRGGLLALDMSPCLLPSIGETDPDWRPGYSKHNPPGNYHNGGIWPFVCAFHVAALVAAGRQQLAVEKLSLRTELVQPAREASVSFGFNEWFSAKDGKPRGQDWQSWSAAMYLYAAECVSTKRTPFFDEMREL